MRTLKLIRLGAALGLLFLAEAQGKATVSLSNSKVFDNGVGLVADGPARLHFQMVSGNGEGIGYMVFEGMNTIEGNNQSGDHTAQGNPGEHPFKDLPPGNVCLP